MTTCAVLWLFVSDACRHSWLADRGHLDSPLNKPT